MCQRRCNPPQFWDVLLQRGPEGDGVLLGVHDVAVLAPLAVQLPVVHLGELGAQGPLRVGVEAAAHQVEAARAVAVRLPPHTARVSMTVHGERDGIDQ